MPVLFKVTFGDFKFADAHHQLTSTAYSVRSGTVPHLTLFLSSNMNKMSHNLPEILK